MQRLNVCSSLNSPRQELDIFIKILLPYPDLSTRRGKPVCIDCCVSVSGPCGKGGDPPTRDVAQRSVFMHRRPVPMHMLRECLSGSCMTIYVSCLIYREPEQDDGYAKTCGRCSRSTIVCRDQTIKNCINVIAVIVNKPLPRQTVRIGACTTHCQMATMMITVT